METDAAAKKAGRAKRSNQRQKHVPQRTCIACHKKDSKRDYVRLVRTNDQTVEVDPTGKRNGRGAYLCPSRGCWRAALDSHAIQQNLKVQLQETDRERLWVYARTHFPPESA